MTAPATEDRTIAMRDATEVVARTMPLARVLAETLAAVPPIEKADGSPVTAADYILQSVVVASLRERSRTGRVPLLGEERSSALASSERADVERLVVDAVRAALGWRDRAAVLRLIDGDTPEPGEACWTIDPIDGTKGFIARSQFSICVALIDAGATVAAALGGPRMGRAGDLRLHLAGPGVVYSAALGGGAFELDPASGQETRLRSAPWAGARIRWARSMNRTGGTGASRLEPLLEAIGTPLESVRIDSQCKYALLARGDADLVVRMPRGPGDYECIWDHAAGALLAQESGAVATDVRGEPLDVGRGPAMIGSAGVLCAAAGLHSRVVGALAPLLVGLPA